MATRLGPLPPGADRPRRPWSLTLVTRVHLDCGACWFVLHLLCCLHEISITHCATVSIHFFTRTRDFLGSCHTVALLHGNQDTVTLAQLPVLSQFVALLYGNQDTVTLSHWRKIDQPGTVVLNMREHGTMSHSGKFPRARDAKTGIFGSRIVRV